MSKPDMHILNHEDVIFFYDYVLSKEDRDIQNRIRLDKLIKKMKLSFEIKISEEKLKKPYPEKPNLLWIINSDEKFEFNKTVIRHLRNAFCHKYISIENDRCKLLDWNQYNKDGKKLEFRSKNITMIGDISYSDLQNLLMEFFSEKSIQKKNKKVKQSKNEK